MALTTGHSASLDFAQPEPVDLSSGKYVKIWQGPQHPGITGNMSLELTLEGDTIIECKTHVGYLHRGFEKLMESRLWMQNIALVPRICVPDPVPMEVSYCLAVEELAHGSLSVAAACTMQSLMGTYFLYRSGNEQILEERFAREREAAGG